MFAEAAANCVGKVVVFLPDTNMSTIASTPFDGWTVRDLQVHLGEIPIHRIRLTPPPGTATEEDVIEAEARTGRPCELIDGTLVEKTVGYIESLLAGAVLAALRQFVTAADLGIVLGEAGALRILSGQVRIPDTCFVAWQRFPGGVLPDVSIPPVAPDLAVEILSPSNTEGEMRRKLRDYFSAGVRLVWFIDWRTRSAQVFTAPDRCETLGQDGVLDGRDVLPGFRIALSDLFAEIEKHRQ